MPEPPTRALIKREDSALVTRMRAPRPVPHDSPGGSSLSKSDILYALFKHKRKILFGTIVGLVAAVAVYFFYPSVYESDAKLLVRYLVERSTVDSVDSPKTPGGYAPTTDTVIASEVEILSSWDLAVETAEAVGVKRLLPHASGTPSKEAAAAVIASGLTLTTHKNSNIIFVSYQNQDPGLVTPVLNELVTRYFNKHLEVHRSAGAFDFVTQQTDQVRARLNQTEDALKDLKSKAGIISLADATKDLSDEAKKTEDYLHQAEADVAEQEARLQQITGSPVGESSKGAAATPAAAQPNTTATGTKPKDKPGSTAPQQGAPPDVVEKYRVLESGLEKLRKTQADLFAKYTPHSQVVKANQAEIDETENQRRDLEKKYPDLPMRVARSGSSKTKELDAPSEAARLAGLRAKKDALTARLQNMQERMRQLSQLRPQFEDLERQKELQESNYKYFEATLEKARVDEALDPSKIPNISAVQRPSPPARVMKKLHNIMGAVAGGGLALTVAFALFKEMVLSGKVKRSVDIEKVVGVSPFLSVPYCFGPAIASASKRNGKVNAIVPKAASRKDIAPWDPNHFIRPYSEAIRDRLGLYFELHNLTHKPKLVGVAAFSEAAGTSTLATGLAAALSESNNGKVLLVDVNLGPDQVHPFFKGKPAYPLNAALGSNEPVDAAVENLYLATVGSPKAGPAQLGLKKFFDLMPNLKASHFDYIIFDMPPLTQTSPTWGMAAFMDKVLLVLEAENNGRETVKRGYGRLVAERDNVCIVLNKVRSYGSKSLELEGS